MSTPLQEFSKKYAKLPDSWRGLALCFGLVVFNLYMTERSVNDFIFGKDGRGGEVLLIKSRIDEHEHEFREERKKYYWHQRLGRYYIPSGFLLNTKDDYKTLTYNYSHEYTYSDPEKLPSGHHPEAEENSFVKNEYFKKL